MTRPNLRWLSKFSWQQQKLVLDVASTLAPEKRQWFLRTVFALVRTESLEQAVATLVSQQYTSARSGGATKH